MKWQERFDKTLGAEIIDGKVNDWDARIKDFISTEIIEKLIDEIGTDEFLVHNGNAIEQTKRQLRDRWLNDQKTTD